MCILGLKLYKICKKKHLLSLNKYNTQFLMHFHFTGNVNYTNGGIPKIIHKTSKYKINEINNITYKTLFDIQSQNKDYKMIYYDDDDCNMFMKSYDTFVYDCYKKLIPGAYKADLFRLCILHKYGGCYSDIGHVNIVDFDNICGDAEIVLTKDNGNIQSRFLNLDYGIHNALICCKPNNIFIKYCIDKCCDNIKSSFIPEKVNLSGSLSITGPIFIGKCFDYFFHNTHDNLHCHIKVGNYTLKNLKMKVLLFTHTITGRFIFDEHGHAVIKCKFDFYKDTMYDNEYSTLPHYGELFKYNIIYMNDEIMNRIKYYIGNFYIDDNAKEYIDVRNFIHFKNINTPWLYPGSHTNISLPKHACQSKIHRCNTSNGFFYNTGNNSTNIKIKSLVIGGDSVDNFNLPTLQKARIINKYKNGILLKLGTSRHWSPVKQLSEIDITWNKKKNTIVWRGVSTGDERMDRHKFVKMYFGKYNIGFTKLVQNTSNDYQKYLIKELSISEMLKYKYIISIEGNDKDSGLNWKLKSNSVVIMKPPKYESWLMEGKLIPWKHYIPLNDDFSNLPYIIEYCNNHDDLCKQISNNATEFMKQFDNELIDRIITHYILKYYKNRFIFYMKQNGKFLLL